MKLLSIIISLALANITANAQFTKAELQASGLTCSMCSFATQKQLMKLDFIDSIGTDLENTTFLLFFKKGKTVNIDQIKKKVEDAGFSVAVLKMFYQFSNQPLQGNHHLLIENTLFHIINATKNVLNGEISFRIVDKNFVADKEFKTYQKQLKDNPCYDTGKMPDADRVFHALLL
jgi:copper chaperone CopZ